MTSEPKPETVRLFEDMLWVNTPKDWIVGSAYTNNTLFISMTIETSDIVPQEKIRRNFSVNLINNRFADLWGLATDCVDEMKRELKTRGDTR